MWKFIIKVHLTNSYDWWNVVNDENIKPRYLQTVVTSKENEITCHEIRLWSRNNAKTQRIILSGINGVF